MAETGSFDNELAVITEKTEAAIQSTDRRLQELEETSCHATDLKQEAAKIDDLLVRTKKLLNEKHQHILIRKDEMMKTIDSIAECNKRYEQTAAEVNSILSEVEILGENITEKSTKINTKREELSKIEDKMLCEIKLIKCKIDQYSTNLGLHIEKKKEVLVFTFKYIGMDDPEMPFSFHLRIENNTDYNVVSCQPMVPDLEKLVTELNKTNNLKNFIHKMRKEFCILARK